MREAGGTITVGARFNGPPTSGNGGYVCGLLGTRIGGPAQVTLWVPPPLETPLSLEWEDAVLVLRDGDTLVADAEATTVDVQPPALVGLADAERAAQGYRGFEHHLFPTCCVCGPDRAPGDGLRLCPGPVEGTTVSATSWTPPADLADGDVLAVSAATWIEPRDAPADA